MKRERTGEIFYNYRQHISNVVSAIALPFELTTFQKAALQNAFANLPKKLKEKAERYYLINLISFEPEQAEKYLVKMQW